MDKASWQHELLRREPLFHRPELIWDARSFDEQVAQDFSEIGASGRLYGREEIKEIVLGRLAGTQPDSLGDDYRLQDCRVRALGKDIAQVRYTLHDQGRVTRRSTLYRRSGSGWQAIFHQGTLVYDAP